MNQLLAVHKLALTPLIQIIFKKIFTSENCDTSAILTSFRAKIQLWESGFTSQIYCELLNYNRIRINFLLKEGL